VLHKDGIIATCTQGLNSGCSPRFEIEWDCEGSWKGGAQKFEESDDRALKGISPPLTQLRIQGFDYWMEFPRSASAAKKRGPAKMKAAKHLASGERQKNMIFWGQHQIGKSITHTHKTGLIGSTSNPTAGANVA
jgi:hypothetical protein